MLAAPPMSTRNSFLPACLLRNFENMLDVPFGLREVAGHGQLYQRSLAVSRHEGLIIFLVVAARRMDRAASQRGDGGIHRFGFFRGRPGRRQ